jgi:mgtE-like transporter
MSGSVEEKKKSSASSNESMRSRRWQRMLDLFQNVLSALVASAIVSLAPGILLSLFSAEMQGVRGLMSLIPALIGMRGNVFGSLSAKLSTTVQSLSKDEAKGLRRGAGPALHESTQVKALCAEFEARYNMSIAETILLSLILPLCVLLTESEGITTHHMISLMCTCVVSGIVSAYIMLYASKWLIFASYNAGYNPDNLAAPACTTLGDTITIPLVLVAEVITRHVSHSSRLLILACAIGLMLFLFAKAFSIISASQATSVFMQRVPVMTCCLTISFGAGIALDEMVNSLESNAKTESAAAVTAFLVALSPMFNAQGGSGGGIFASRISTFVDKHSQAAARKKSTSQTAKTTQLYSLPLVPPATIIREGIVLAASIYVVMTCLTALMIGSGIDMSASSAAIVSYGMGTTIALSSVVAYYTTLICLKFNMDPDNIGVPIVCATMDLLASIAFLNLAMVATGVNP